MPTIKDAMLKVHYALGHDPVSSSLYVSDSMIASWFNEAIKVLSEYSNIMECVGMIRLVTSTTNYAFDICTPLNWTDLGGVANAGIYPAWHQPWTPALGTWCRPTVTRLAAANGQGCVYQCTTSGAVGGTEPATWTTTEGATVSDGSAVWTAHQVKVADVLAVIPLDTTGTGTTNLAQEKRAAIRLRPGKKLMAYGSTITSTINWWYFADRKIYVEPATPSAYNNKYASVFFFGCAPKVIYVGGVNEINTDLQVIGTSVPDNILVEYALFRAKQRYCAYNEGMFHYQMFMNYANQVKADSIARCLGKLTDVEEV